MKTNTIILVTGSAGFIGYSVARDLLEKGYRVVGVDNFNTYYTPTLKHARITSIQKYKSFVHHSLDIGDYVKLQDLFVTYRFTHVCHMAAQAGVRYSLENPFVYEKYNIAGFLNILELCRHYKIQRLVYASSSSVYGNNKKIPFAESDSVDNPISLYAATKKANELMAHCYSHVYNIQTIGLRFFTVYGPWGRPDMAVWLFTEAISRGTAVCVFNNGEIERDFTYIDDIVHGVRAALFSKNLGLYEIINLGNNRSEAIMDVITCIEKCLDKKAKIQLLPMQPGDVNTTFADISKARKLLGYNPCTSITDGIPKFVKWYTTWIKHEKDKQ